MLTRSHARSLARKEAAARAAGIAVVSPSATGKGTHIRWTYPEDMDERLFRLPGTRTRIHYKIDDTDTCLITSHSSSISSRESSNEDIPVVTPNSSFDASIPVTPQRNNKPLTTPPRLSPKKLQRSPRGRWITENGATRLVFVEEPQEQTNLRKIQDEIKYQRIEERELEILLRERDMANGWKDEDFVMDDETVASGIWRDQTSSVDVYEVNTDETMGARLGLAPAANTRGDMEIPLMAGGSGRVRPLGPHGTELVDPVTFMPYSMGSIEASRIETWRQGVL